MLITIDQPTRSRVNTVGSIASPGFSVILVPSESSNMTENRVTTCCKGALLVIHGAGEFTASAIGRWQEDWAAGALGGKIPSERGFSRPKEHIAYERHTITTYV